MIPVSKRRSRASYTRHPAPDIKELQQTRALLVEKYGKEFGQSAMDNAGAIVPERVLRKLRVEPPEAVLVDSYLKAIASAYDVPYGEEEEVTKDDGAGRCRRCRRRAWSVVKGPQHFTR